MSYEDMTVREVKEIARMFSACAGSPDGINDAMLGQKVIVRTYSAGVWFGRLSIKQGAEVILEDARRMWEWWAEKSISLSGVALYGVKQGKSRIAPPVSTVWLEAIEIIPVTPEADKSLSGAPHAEAR